MPSTLTIATALREIVLPHPTSPNKDAIFDPPCAKKYKNLNYAFSTFTANTPHIFLDINRTKAENLNIEIATLFNALNNNFGSAYINNITLDGQINKVIAQADFEGRKNIENVLNLYVKSNDNNLVRLKNLVDTKIEISPKILYRYNTYPAASITGGVAQNKSSGDAIESISNI